MAEKRLRLTFEAAVEGDAAHLAALHDAVADYLRRKFGQGHWSFAPSERSMLRDLRNPRFSRTVIARRADGRIARTLRLATKKPWAIDTAYFSETRRPLYLTGMAVDPGLQRRGVGRLLMQEAEAVARAWPADAIRLDAYDAEAGAGAFYAKCGYAEVGRVSYKGNPLVYFELALSGYGAGAEEMKRKKA